MHKNGTPIAKIMMDLTLLQKLFLQFMAVEDLKHDKNFDIKIDALCKSQGIKFR